MLRCSLIILFLSLVSVYGCKEKLKPNEFSRQFTWEIKEPIEGSTFLRGDTIFIDAKVSSPDLITNVEVRVHNEQDKIVSDRIVFYPDSKEHSFTGFIILNGIRIEAGSHFLNFYAAGNEGIDERYVNFQIREGTYELDNAYYSTVKSGKGNIYRLDDSSNWQLLKSFSEPLVGLDGFTKGQLIFGLPDAKEIVCINSYSGITNWVKNRSNLWDFPVME